MNALARTNLTADNDAQERDHANAAARTTRNVVAEPQPPSHEVYEFLRLQRRAADLGWLLVDCDGVLTLKEMGEGYGIVRQDGKPLTLADVRGSVERMEARLREGVTV